MIYSRNSKLIADTESEKPTSLPNYTQVYVVESGLQYEYISGQYVLFGGPKISKTNHVIVKSLEDFPSPIDGVINLVNNTSYEINGLVDIGTNRIALGSKTALMSFDRFINKLTSQTTGDMITGVLASGSCIIDSLTLSCPNGRMFNLDSISAIFDKCSFSTVKTLGLINNTTNFFIRNCGFTNAVTTTGFSFTGATNGSLQIRDTSFANNAGTLFNLTNAGADPVFVSIDISRNRVTSNASQTFFLGVSAGANVSLAANLHNNIFSGLGAYVSGVTNSDSKWNWSGNIGLSDSPMSQSVISGLTGDLTNKKTDSMSTNKLLGRGTAGTGVIEEITLGTNLSLVGNVLNAGSGGLAAWGTIAGVLSSQTDLQSALDAKQNASANSGTVTGCSIVSANGFAGTVATSTTTPAITLTTPVTGILKGNGSAISTAVAGADYLTVLTGDVTTSGNAATIPNAVITLAKMADIATASFIGRNTAGIGVPEVLSVAVTRSILSIDNVTNTSDASKPVSTAQQTALDLKSNLAGPTFTGVPAAPTAAANTNTTQLATTAFVASAVANPGYSTILEACGSHIAARVAGTYAIPMGSALAISGTGTLYPLSVITISAADYPTVNGLAPKLRIRGQVFVNDVAPTGNFTFGLYPITRPSTSGGAGLNIYTLGTLVTGSGGITVSAPAADSANNLVGSDFDLPADGLYVIGVVTTATVATSSHLHINAQLQKRNN